MSCRSGVVVSSDWVKMRTDLYRDPKVSVIAAELMSPDGDLARFVSQNCQCDMTVTRNVMRNVTVGALVSVWGVMRQRGKRNDDDLVCQGVTVAVLDDIADLPGFGAAMQSAGWVAETGDGIKFPRFFEEFNVEPSASPNAIRQRRYRERKNATSNVTGDVTRNVTVTPRVEKSREEKKEQEQKNPAAGASGSRRSKSPKCTFERFVADCKTADEKPIPVDHPVFRFAEETAIPVEFVRLVWREFRRTFGPGGKDAGKQQAGMRGWRQHFDNAVRRNWFKLWSFNRATGECYLTDAGIALQREADAEAHPLQAAA
jgi:hypothetical protein